MPAQTTNIHVSGPTVGLSFQSQSVWVIAPGVTVASDDNDGVRMDHGFSWLINHGTTIGADSIVVGFNNNSIENAADGQISGNYGVCFVSGGYSSGVNFGSIDTAFAGLQFADDLGNVTFDNRGSIYSTIDGAYIASAGNGDSLTNSGSVEGGYAAVLVDLQGAGLFASVSNSGVMSGGSVAVVVDNGALHLQNTGTLIGAIEMLTPGDADIVVNHGHIYGAVSLGGGNDLFNGSGGTSGPIDGGLGADTLTGGPGMDQFVFDTALGPTNIDHIANFHHAADKIDLSHGIFAAAGTLGTLKAAAFFAGATAHDATDRILYNPANGFLSYDVDGSGHAHAPVHFSTLAAHLALTATDFLVTA
jgi:serralysin